jgi:ferrous-iron efflux pump FieF
MRRIQVLTSASLAGSLLLMVGLFGAWWEFGSQLALAQAADSFMDVFTAAVLIWAVFIAAQRPDKEHPFGHSRAEPIGALVVAVVAGVLAIEVGRSAVEALWTRKPVRLDLLLVVVFGAKFLFKSLMYGFARKGYRRTSSPALKALAVDARNDMLVSVLAIGGFFVARYGAPRLDAWLALPVAAWIGFTGVELARDNIRLLMGEAPPMARQQELQRVAAAIDGVKDAHDLRAHFVGTELHVHVHVVVAADLTVQQAHDIGEAVRMRIEEEEDVGHCSVHIDIR